MRKLLVAGLLAVSLVIPAAVSATDTPSPAAGLQEVAAARAATTRFRNVQAARDAGYVQVAPCIPGMGIHFVNFGLVLDPAVHATAPEGLLYVPSGNGLRLIGAEYMTLDVASPAPTLFGQPMDGPMAGHGPSDPAHYDLHVWLGQGNPDGLLTEMNPSIRC